MFRPLPTALTNSAATKSAHLPDPSTPHLAFDRRATSAVAANYGSLRSLLSGAFYENRSEVVQVGAGRAGDQEIAESGEEVVGVVGG